MIFTSYLTSKDYDKFSTFDIFQKPSSMWFQFVDFVNND